MMINRFFVILMLWMLTAPTVIAQIVDLNRSVQRKINNTFIEQYPTFNYNTIEWKLEDGIYIGAFTYENRNYVSIFNTKGKWLETSEKVDMIDLPIKLQNKLSREYNSLDIFRIRRVFHHNDKIYYDIFLSYREDPLRFDVDGNLLLIKDLN